jgi:hypothetical protein
MKRAFAALFVLNAVSAVEAAAGRKWATDDTSAFILDTLNTSKSAAELAVKGLELWMELAKTRLLAKYGKATGGARLGLLRADLVGKRLKTAGNVLTVADAVLRLAEAVPDYKRGRTTVLAFRLTAVGLGLCGLAAPAFWPALALFVAGAVLDALIAAAELTDEEGDLFDLLKKTEFGVDGYRGESIPELSAATAPVKPDSGGEPPLTSYQQVARRTPDRDLYTSIKRFALRPEECRKHLLGLPWRAFPALLPFAPDTPGSYIEGILVRVMPLPALAPVSTALVPGRVLITQETVIGVENLRTVTLTLAPPTGPANPVLILEQAQCWADSNPVAVLPLISAGGDLVFLVPPRLTESTTVVRSVVVTDTRAVYLALGPHRFGRRFPGPEANPGPPVVRTGTDNELRGLAKTGASIEIGRPGARETLTKLSPPHKVARVVPPSRPGDR